MVIKIEAKFDLLAGLRFNSILNSIQIQLLFNPESFIAPKHSDSGIKPEFDWNGIGMKLFILPG